MAKRFTLPFVFAALLCASADLASGLPEDIGVAGLQSVLEAIRTSLQLPALAADPASRLPQDIDVGVAGDGGLQSVLEAIRTGRQLPALAAVSVHNGQVVEMAATGVRAIGYEEQVQTDDLWLLNSVSKAITATLAAVLVDRGLLSWEATIGEILPDLVPSMRDEYVDVPLRELLYHTGGLPTKLFTEHFSWASLFTDSTPIIEQRRDYAAELLAEPPVGPRGEHNYSNAGYVVAGVMMEEVTRVSWEEFVRVEIFEALGMASCGFGAPDGSGRDQPWGHWGVPGHWTAIPPALADVVSNIPPAIGPAGSVHCSVADYAKFMVEHLANATGAKDGIVSADSFDELHSPPPGSPDYSMGWGVSSSTWAKGRVLEHDGTDWLWVTYVLLAPEIGLGLFVATNSYDFGGGLDHLIEALIRRHRAGLFLNADGA
ncbi:unnamed protein product [Vitrella brassicaformis CCMP3155]|uniref:Beta-lactamase-related domain-containing protein n=2 Tax=Vitrella brassicaformis TaxID=1169539 RepID=A0A0G4FNP3_VITBC|nr:unnamed protein product [Vitrella brassicaformis CCMP3155]|eukprot:CEM15840.1 unnamed protein product [Vitrella brassicaformis CCMP3155]